LAPPGHINIARVVENNGRGNVSSVPRRSIVARDPLLLSDSVVLDCAVIEAFLACYINIASTVERNGITFTADFTGCPLLLPRRVILDCRVIVEAPPCYINIARVINSDGFGSV
jgi:hypothetical protein